MWVLYYCPLKSHASSLAVDCDSSNLFVLQQQITWHCFGSELWFFYSCSNKSTWQFHASESWSFYCCLLHLQPNTVLFCCHSCKLQIFSIPFLNSFWFWLCKNLKVRYMCVHMGDTCCEKNLAVVTHGQSGSVDHNQLCPHLHNGVTVSGVAAHWLKDGCLST